MKSHWNNGMKIIKITESDGSTRNLWIHKEVARAFLPAPQPGVNTIIHKDFDRGNNCVNNLEWVEGYVKPLYRVHRLVNQQVLEVLEELKNKTVPNPTTPAGDGEFIPLSAINEIEKRYES